MNIKKSQLMEIIRDTVKECINERKNKHNIKEMSIPHDYDDDNKKMRRMEAGLTSEASYKVVSPRQYDIQQDNTALTVQTDPEINEVERPESEEKDEAKIGHALVKLGQKLISLHSAKSVKEASYKVVSPRQYRVQKDNVALTIQSDPKINETAYKTQGPSGKVHADSPQFPEALNNPENA